ncbi:MAG: hypothetical protein GU352_02635 [Acidilobus sp.]|nr:hypothetical protein [Acidilobus sp.]
MNRIGKLALVAGILAIALAVPIAAANVIYLYVANTNMKLVQPFVNFTKGPDSSEVGLTLSNRSPQITLTVPVTNATEIYVYQALIVNVSTPPSPLSGSPTLYVEYCTYSGSPSFNNITLVVYPVSGNTGKPVPTGSVQTIVIKPSTSSCSASGSATLTASSYYIDFAIYPAQPIYKGPVSLATPGTLQIVFGFSYGSATPTSYGSITSGQGFVPYPYP